MPQDGTLVRVYTQLGAFKQENHCRVDAVFPRKFSQEKHRANLSGRPLWHLQNLPPEANAKGFSCQRCWSSFRPSISAVNDMWIMDESQLHRRFLVDEQIQAQVLLDLRLSVGSFHHWRWQHFLHWLFFACCSFQEHQDTKFIKSSLPLQTFAFAPSVSETLGFKLPRELSSGTKTGSEIAHLWTFLSFLGPGERSPYQTQQNTHIEL